MKGQTADTGRAVNIQTYDEDVEQIIALPEFEDEDTGDVVHGCERTTRLRHAIYPQSSDGNTAEENHRLSPNRLYPSPPATQSQSSTGDEPIRQVKKERITAAPPRPPSPVIRLPSGQQDIRQGLAAHKAAQEEEKRTGPERIYQQWLAYDGDDDLAEFSEKRKRRLLPAEGSVIKNSEEKTPYERLMLIRTSSGPNKPWRIHHGKQKLRRTPLRKLAVPFKKVKVESKKPA